MRNRLLLKIALITTIALLISVGMSIGVFYYINISTFKDNLNKTSSFLVSNIQKCKNESELDELLININDHMISISVIGSNNYLIADSREGESIIENFDEDPNVERARRDGSYFKIGKPYTNNATMLMQFVTVHNPHIDDGQMVVRVSVIMVQNDRPVWLAISLGILIWVVVVVGAYIVINASVNAAIEPISEIEQSLRNIAKGEFHNVNIARYEDEDLDNLFGQIDEISNQISTSLADLQQEQLKSKFLLGAMSQGILAVSKMGTVMLNNNAIKNILDYEDLSGANIDAILDEESAKKIVVAIKNNQNTVFTMSKNDKVYRVETLPTEQYVDTKVGNVQMMIVFTDVTQEYQNARIRSEFFANASHELKTPLTAIIGYSEIMSMNKDASVVEKCSHEIVHNASKMKELINDMLRLSRLDSQKDVEKSKEFDLYEICSQIVEEQRDVAENKNVSIVLKGKKATMIGKQDMIKTVVQNLLNNAIKYNKEGGNVEMSVSKKNDVVTLKVKDTGIGIPKEHIDRIFERFYKVDNARTRTQESSTGLGLAIVKHVVQIHGGNIKVDSKEGIGTTFTINFCNNQCPDIEHDNDQQK